VGKTLPRVLVDTNVWISFFINVAGAPAQVLDAFLAEQFVPVVSEELLDDIGEVLDRPRIRCRWRLRGEDVAAALTLLTDRAVANRSGAELRHNNS
jgi:putative PIN family toxin of toxin-antitoxin system